MSRETEGFHGDTPCHSLEVISPAGLEDYFREISDSRSDLERFAEINAKCDLWVLAHFGLLDVNGVFLHGLLFRWETVRRVPEKVAMTLTGHETRSVFDRYDVVTETGLREQSTGLEAYLEQSRKGTRGQGSAMNRGKARKSETA